MWGNATTEEDSKACITRFENLLNTSHRSCILPTTLCAVCSCNSSNKHTHTIAIKDLPGLHLLDASLPKTREEPRAAHTTFSYASKTYCLQPLAIHNNIVSVCSTCLDHLSTKKDSPMDSQGTKTTKKKNKNTGTPKEQSLETSRASTTNS